MKRATNILPSSISAVRLVAWYKPESPDAKRSIYDVCEVNTAMDFRKQAQIAAHITVGGAIVEIVSSDERMKLKATVEKGIPEGCRTEQVCIRLSPTNQPKHAVSPDDRIISLDRFWSLLCETAAEMQQPSHFCNDECRCNNE